MQCGAVVSKYDAKRVDWQLGHTKVFLRERLELVLEKARTETMAKIQAVILGHVERKRYRTLRAAAVTVAAWWKAHFYARRYQRQKKAAITVQARYRGYRARKQYKVMLEAKRKEEARQRELNSRSTCRGDFQ